MKLRTILTVAAVALLASSAGATPKRPAKAPAAAADWTKIVAATPEGGHRLGNPNAPVKLIEYGSRTCPHCAHFDAEGLPALKAGMLGQGQVSYEFRDFPIHGPIDMGPILLGRCAGTRAFFPLLEAMMANQKDLIGRTEQFPADEATKLANAPPEVVTAALAKHYGYVDFVTKRGLTPARAAACLADKAALMAVAKQTSEADKLYHVSGTPTFIVNGKVVSANSWDALEPLLKAAGAK